MSLLSMLNCFASSDVSSFALWTSVICVIVVILLTVYVISWNTSFVRSVEALPGPKCNLLFGNSFQLMVKYEDIFLELTKLVETIEQPVVRLWTGQDVLIVIKRGDLLEKLINSSVNITKSSDYLFLDDWLGQGLLTSTGSHWHNHRKLLIPAFHFNILKQFVGTINHQSDILIEKLQKRVGSGKFDIIHDLTLCALDVISETSMGRSINAQMNEDCPYVKAVAEMGRIFFLRLTRPWLRIDWIFKMSSYYRGQKRAIKILHSFSEEVITERQKTLESKRHMMSCTDDIDDERVVGQKERLALLDLLLVAAETNDNFTRNHIREEVDTFMFAGHDTSSAALGFSLFLLGHHHDVQEKAFEEIHQILGDGDQQFTASDISKLKYLEAVIKESMRLFPPVPLYGRYLTEDVVIGGYRLPAGVNALISSYHIHRDPNVFPSPKKFDPSRFLQISDDKRHPFSYIPFSAGPRNCIGQKFAMMFLKITLAKILYKFSVTSYESMDDIRYFMQPVIQAVNGIQVSLELR